jgi:ribonuclease R
VPIKHSITNRAKLEVDTESRNQIIKDLKILASQNKIIESEPENI